MGHEEYGFASKDKKTYEILKVLNTHLSRTGYRTIPSLLKGDLGSAVSSEFGIYPSKESREFQKKTKKSLPDPLTNALNALSGHHKKALEKQDIEYLNTILGANKKRKEKAMFGGKSFLE